MNAVSNRNTFPEFLAAHSRLQIYPIARSCDKIPLVTRSKRTNPCNHTSTSHTSRFMMDCVCRPFPSPITYTQSERKSHRFDNRGLSGMRNNSTTITCICRSMFSNHRYRCKLMRPRGNLFVYFHVSATVDASICSSGTVERTYQPHRCDIPTAHSVADVAMTNMPRTFHIHVSNCSLKPLQLQGWQSCSIKKHLFLCKALFLSIIQ